MHTIVTQVSRSSNKWFSTHISRIFGFHSRLKSEKAKSGKVLNTGLTDALTFESGQVDTPVKPTMFEFNVGAVVQRLGFSVDQWTTTLTVKPMIRRLICPSCNG
jgi:hypothetical protein